MGTPSHECLPPTEGSPFARVPHSSSVRQSDFFLRSLHHYRRRTLLAQIEIFQAYTIAHQINT